MKPFLMALSLVFVLSFMSGKYIFISSAPEQSVMGISHSLACPCECPMVLEDCHMSCGLSWKDQIGAQLMAGKPRTDITGYFYKRYGEAALLTPSQRVAGKWYQVTRGGYPMKDMVLFVAIVAVWASISYLVLMSVAEKIWPVRKK